VAVSREFGRPTTPEWCASPAAACWKYPRAAGRSGDTTIALWLQVRIVELEHDRLAAAGVRILRPPQQEPWDLVEMWIANPDGVRLVPVQIPDDHPLRRDQR